MALQLRRGRTSSFGKIIATSFAVLALVLQPLLSTNVPAASAAELDSFLSTNQQNKANGNPYVELVSSNYNTVVLKYVNPRPQTVWFEQRVDSAAPGTSQHGPCRVGNPSLPSGCQGKRYLAADDYSYASVSVGGNSNINRTYSNVQNQVSVRSTFGPERTWDFDWTNFAITPGACVYDFPASKMWEVTWGYDFANRNGGATKFTVQSNGGLVSLNGGAVPSYMTGSWRWIYPTEGNEMHYTYGFADGTVRKVDITFTTLNGCQIPNIVWTTQLSAAQGSFVNSPRYVRVNSADETARILVPSQATEARFFVDGSTTPITGTFVNASSATTEWWKLTTPLAAGQHTITAQVKIGGDWSSVAGSGIANSIDSPWAQYVIPQAGQYFRSNDRVVRVKADDQFDQFNRMVTVVNGISHTVNRADCNDQGAYVLCDLQNLNLPEGTYTASTTTYTKANNRVDSLVSAEFTIDNERPVLSNFKTVNPASVYGASISVTAEATDANGIEDVAFYLTAPRADGVCDGNGARLRQYVITSAANGDTYAATFNTAGLQGAYCLNAIAGDNAANHSSPVATIKVGIDGVAPVLNITSIFRNSNGSYTISGTTDDAADVAVSLNGGSALSAVTPTSSGFWQVVTPILIDGPYTAEAKSTDGADNVGNTSSSFEASTPPKAAPVFTFVPTDTTSSEEPASNGERPPTPITVFPAPIVALGDQAVLGDEDAAGQNTAGTSSDVSDQDVKGTSDEKKDSAFSLAWYWWLAILAAIIALWLLIAAALRRRKEEN